MKQPKGRKGDEFTLEVLVFWAGGLPRFPPPAIRGGRSAAITPHPSPAILEVPRPSNCPYNT